MSIPLTTTYLGLELPSPIVVGAAAPLSSDLRRLEQLEREGAGAVVLHSLFLEQIERDWREWIHHQQHSSESHPEALSYLPAVDPQHLGLEGYLAEIRRAREALSIPVIASLNGTSPGRWVESARRIEAAGASALELNIYAIPTDPELSSAAIEAGVEEIVRQVRAEVRLPLAVKLSPFFTNLSAMAKRLAAAGADGLVLFNRFYQPDILPEELELNRSLRPFWLRGTFNGDGAESKGLEANWLWRATENLSIDGSVFLAEAEYTGVTTLGDTTTELTVDGQKDVDHQNMHPNDADNVMGRPCRGRRHPLHPAQSAALRAARTRDRPPGGVPARSRGAAQVCGGD